MRLKGDRLWLSDERRRASGWRIPVYLVLIAVGAVLVFMVQTGEVEPLFLPTATPTRLPTSYAIEGSTRFSAGDLEGAVEAYKKATELDPSDSQLWSELARIQAYSSSLLTTSDERKNRLAEARQSIDRAIEVDPENSFVQAIKALVYDWSASAQEPGSVARDDFLTEAFNAAVQAYRLDSENSLALAFYAEVLLDQQKFAQAVQFAAKAVEEAEAQGLNSIDVNRVYGTVLEGTGQYRVAIEAYEKALAINPNLTFLHLLIGANYRQLRNIDAALEYFDTAARINEQNGIKDPTPFLAIGKTYLQEGEFFIAARNVESALRINPTNPDIFGRLGIVYYKARNYESALDVLECSVYGCSSERSRELLCRYVDGCDPAEPEAQQFCVDVGREPLGANSLEYYYTYGSVLAFYGYCESAEAVFRELLDVYGDDAIVAGIVEEGRLICTAASLPEPTATPEIEPPPCSDSTPLSPPDEGG